MRQTRSTLHPVGRFVAAALAPTALLIACASESPEGDDDANAPLTPPTGSTAPIPSAEPSAPAPPSTPTPPSATAAPTAAPTAVPSVPTPGAGGVPGSGGMPSAETPGTGGAGGMPGGPAVENTSIPPDNSEAALTEFITAERYKAEGWVADTDAPRDAESTASPHGRVRVYLTDNLAASIAAGNGGVGSTTGVPHPTGSMTVKEMYDGETMIGIAALLKHAEGAEDWTMWCYGAAGRCGFDGAPAADAPFYAENPFECGICHGGNVFSDPSTSE